MRHIWVLVAALLAGSVTAQAADVGANYLQGPGGYYSQVDHSGPYGVAPDGTFYPIGKSDSSSATAGSIATNQATANTTSSQLCAARTSRRAVTLENLGTTPVYYGALGVTSTTGALLPGATGSNVTLNTSAAIYGVTITGTQAVACVETF